MKSNWPLVKLEEVAELTVGFVGTMAKHYTQDGVTFLRSTNIEPFNVKFDDIKFISSEFNEKISKSQLHGGDVVIVRTGKPGACTVIPEIEGSWNCSDLVIVRPHQEKLDPLYLAAYINLASGTINNQLVGAVQQHFNVASAKKLEIPIPPIEVQRKISSLIGNLNDKIAINNKINDNLAA
jgi:type I restriction enzyme S subunit